MPKIIELTVEIEVQRVSCPGVWLCQDGRVSLTVFALDTSYQTCLLPPVFPLMFKDVFYFRKRFQETCALNNICCLLKDETVYCELVQWCEDCTTGECTVLAQYLGALNDVLFPPNMCSNDGVDLLMRRSKEFPGILSPKIEITTKVRIDEVWNQPLSTGSMKKVSCHCTQPDLDAARQKPVCHSAKYHRSKCNSVRRLPAMSKPRPRSRSRSRSRSGGSRSWCSLTPHEHEPEVSCKCPKHKNEPSKHIHSPANFPCPSSNPVSKSRVTVCSPRSLSTCRRKPQYCVYDVETGGNVTWMSNNKMDTADESDCDDVVQRTHNETDKVYTPSRNSTDPQKFLLESHYIDHESSKFNRKEKPKKIYKTKTTPCVCEICKRYYELFHSDLNCKS